eukprot:1153561-Pleurochrysis_carterae.AAC.5
MYCQATRARRTVFRVSDVTSARSHTPFEQATASSEGENDAIAFGRGRRENGSYISKAAFGGRRLPESIDREQRITKAWNTTHISKSDWHFAASVVYCRDWHIGYRSALLGSAIDASHTIVTCSHIH